MAAVESLAALVGPGLPSLFEPTPGEVQRAIGRLAGGDRFSALAREFFAPEIAEPRLPPKSRAFQPHRRWRAVQGRCGTLQFDRALDRDYREAARIVEAFAGGWYGKNVYQGDGLTPDAVRRFAPVAFGKIQAELRKRRDAGK